MDQIQEQAMTVKTIAKINTLSKQMGNSEAMIERHCSKLTATMAANKLA
jgi:hypothetical protein